MVRREKGGKTVIGLLQQRATRPKKIQELLRLAFNTARPKATPDSPCKDNAKIILMLHRHYFDFVGLRYGNNPFDCRFAR